jgi:predicted transcriptional regulator
VSIREAVAAAYGLSLAEVARWSDRTVDVMHRKAIDLGLINTQPTCEVTDDPEVLPF